MNRIEPATLEAIRERLDIVALVGRDVALRRKGASFMGRCPFHEDQTPSLSVVPGRGYRCFGCGAHGDAIRYVEQSRGLSFADAVRELGRELGIDVSDVADDNRTPAIPCVTPTRFPGSAAPRLDVLEQRAELLELWGRCLPIAVPPNATEGQHLAWCALWESGIDPALAASLDLARVLPDGGALPQSVPDWWRRGWWLVLPTSDPLGGFAGVRARFVGRHWNGLKRSPPFAGKEVSCGGAVSADRTYACPMAVAVLKGDRAIESGGGRLEWDGSLLLAEGGRGFLSARCAAWAGPVETPDAHATRAVLGLWSGSWSRTIADQIPSGTRVVIAADHDDAGNRYADVVASTIESRCSVARWTAHVENAP